MCQGRHFTWPVKIQCMQTQIKHSLSMTTRWWPLTVKFNLIARLWPRTRDQRGFVYKTRKTRGESTVQRVSAYSPYTLPEEHIYSFPIRFTSSYVVLCVPDCPCRYFCSIRRCRLCPFGKHQMPYY